MKKTRLPLWILELIWTIGFGFVIFFIPYFMGHDLFWGDMSEKVFDEQIRLNQSIEPPNPATPQFIFLDIDQETYYALDFPTIIPRKQIALVLEKIAAADPQLIILDIDISWPLNTECLCPSGADDVLFQTLQHLNKKQIPTLLVRQLLSPFQNDMPLYFRPTPFDNVVDGSSVLQWVNSEFRTSGDGIIRRSFWWSWGCRKDQSVIVLPNSALLAAVFITAKKQDGWIKTVSAEINAGTNHIEEQGRLQELCKGSHRLKESVHRLDKQNISFSIKGEKKEFLNSEPNDRIRYTVGWHPNEHIMYMPIFENGSPLLKIMSAKQIFQSPNEVNMEGFKDTVVIIGSSSPDQQDFHLTPLGEMPGSFVLFNSIRAIIEFGTEESFGIWQGLGFTFTILATIFFLCKFLFYFFMGHVIIVGTWHTWLLRNIPIIFPIIIGIVISLIWSWGLFYLILAILPYSTPPMAIVILPFIINAILTVVEIRTSRYN